MNRLLYRMMIALGLRAETTSVNWAIVEGSVDAPVLIACNNAEAPRVCNEPQALTWLRSRIVDIIDQYTPDIVAVRLAEPISRGAAMEGAKRRSRVEGVLLEVGSSKNLPIFSGALVTLSKGLGSASAKSYLTQAELRGLEWSKYAPNKREAILAATAALGQL